MSARAPLVLAVDGGGTKTELALADRDGRLVALARGAGTNLMDNDGWREQLVELFAGAAPYLPRVEFAILGLPGFGEVRRFDERLLATAADLFSGPRQAVNDVELALDGAFLDSTGIVILAGTGSMAMARDARGRTVRVGGWGETFGDEGSAFWIGRQALAHATRALDGRIDAIDFANAILTSLGLDAANPYDALMGWCYGAQHSRSAIAAVAKAVDALAEAGGPVALAILRRAAEHLSAHIAAIQRHLQEAGRLPWSFGGSVLESRTIGDALIAWHGEPAPPRLSPIAAGLWRAARQVGWSIDDSWIQRLGESVRAGYGSSDLRLNEPEAPSPATDVCAGAIALGEKQ